MEHITVMERAKPYNSMENLAYNYKSWNARFVCPVCGKETWQNLNFLGSKWVPTCDGKKVKKVLKAEVTA